MNLVSLCQRIIRIPGQPTNQRKYWELWGDLVSQNCTLRIFLLVEFIVIIALSSSLTVLSRRPATVIRVNEVGKAQVIAEMESHNAPQPYEIERFVTDFLEFYSAMDSKTIVSDMAQAMNMMTPEYQKLHEKNLKEQNLIGKIQSLGIKTRIKIVKVWIVSESDRKIFVRIDGINHVSSISGETDREKTTGFKSRLGLRKYSRSKEIPYGVLVDSYDSKIVPVEEVTNPTYDFENLRSLENPEVTDETP